MAENCCYFINTNPFAKDFFNFGKIETGHDRADRLERELAELRTTTAECNKIIGQSCVVNKSDLNGIMPLPERCKRLRAFAEMAEHAECELRDENEELKHDLAQVSCALASVTEKLAATAA